MQKQAIAYWTEVLFLTQKAFSAMKQNEQLIDEILHEEKI